MAWFYAGAKGLLCVTAWFLVSLYFSVAAGVSHKREGQARDINRPGLQVNTWSWFLGDRILDC